MQIPVFLIVFLLAGVATVILAVGQSIYWGSVARRDRERVEIVRRLGMLTPEMQDSLFRERAKDATAGALGTLGEHFQGVLDRADSRTTVGALVGQMFIAASVVAILVLILFGVPAGLAAGAIALVVPYLLMVRAGNVRRKKLMEQLPEALDLMARSLQAGLGLNEAFRTCAEEMPLPVAAEFGRVFEEVRFGRDYREALQNLIKRNPTIFDLRLFVSSVLLQRETGGNLIEILESIAGTIRGRFLFHAKVSALTSEARFSAVILGGLPLCVGGLVSLANPEYLIPLFTDWLGNLFLGYFVLSYVCGVGLMVWISQVEA